MIITPDWIHKHTTPAGGWNAKQLKILGLRWPARKGWISNISGNVITDQQRIDFESAAKKAGKVSLESRVEKLELIVTKLQNQIKQKG